MPNSLDVERALGAQPVERQELLTIDYHGDKYSKIEDKWYVWDEDCLEPAYQMHDELEEFLEELEQ